MNFDWSELAFGSKSALRETRAIFIAAPRDISQKRFIEIVKKYLPKANVVLGLAKEEYIDGFDGQPHFKTLAADKFIPVIEKINANPQEHKIYTLGYFQRELKHILDAISFQKVLLVNGSWKHSFHTTEPFYSLVKKNTPYELIPAFKDQEEALAYEEEVTKELKQMFEISPGRYAEHEMLQLCDRAARYSFDYSFQTGVVLGKKSGGKKGMYDLKAWTWNKVVPYQTYALLHGASRETNFSPPNDLNHYDTVHAEVELLVKAQREHISLKNTTLFINLLPCPSCSRMFAETEIEEFVYRIDHSDGYAVKMLEAAGKKVRRIVT